MFLDFEFTFSPKSELPARRNQNISRLVSYPDITQKKLNILFWKKKKSNSFKIPQWYSVKYEFAIKYGRKLKNLL